MKPKLFLGILLLFTIFYQLFFIDIKEGVCNYEDGTVVDSNGRVIKRSSASCQESGIYTNSSNLSEVERKLNELEVIAKKTKNSVNKQNNKILKNFIGAIRMGNAVASDNNQEKTEEGAHCEKYPDACVDQKPYPKKPSPNKVKNLMN